MLAGKRGARLSPVSPLSSVCKQQTRAGFAGSVCLFSACPKALSKYSRTDNGGQGGLQEPSINLHFLPDPKHLPAVP